MRLERPDHDADTGSAVGARVLAEFIRQAEEEESKDLPVAPFMLGLAESRLAQVKTQIDFINYAVRPVRRLFVCLTACLCVEVCVCGVLHYIQAIFVRVLVIYSCGRAL